MRAASLAYFGKEPRRLTLGEAALLVALPQSPEARRPDRSPTPRARARDRVLDRVAAAGRRAGRRGRARQARAGADGAPADADAGAACRRRGGRGGARPQRMHRLTIDAQLQKSLEELARERARALGPEISVAILAVDHATGEVLARVGSADYFDSRRAGQVDMTQALRSPGSTLKPFIYGLGFEDGLVHPETLIEDRPIRFGGYAPENFDLTFQGTVTVRQALQLSLNVPAVAVLDTRRRQPLRRAARAGRRRARAAARARRPGSPWGSAASASRSPISSMLYAGARAARHHDAADRARGRCRRARRAPRRLLDPVAAWYVGNILLGTPPPDNAAGGRIAFKTGTSYGYRDAWAVGFDGKRTIGVWVGRPDGAPVPGPDRPRRGGADPVRRLRAHRQARRRRCRRRPRARWSPRTASCRRRCSASARDALRRRAREPPLRIMFPPNGARLELASGGDGKPDPVALKIAGGVEPLTVLVNGVPVAAPAGRRTLFFEPDGPGLRAPDRDRRHRRHRQRGGAAAISLQPNCRDLQPAWRELFA